MNIIEKIDGILEEGKKMRTNNGFEYPIPKVEKVQKYADTIGLSDSRIMAGAILDWSKLNKVKIEDIIKKSASDEEIAKLAKKVFMGNDMRKATPSSKQLKSLIEA